MSMSAGRSGGNVKAEPNVTPMIDVMLVLLIIFMVVTPALLAGFNAVPPQGQNLKDHPEDAEDLIGLRILRMILQVLPLGRNRVETGEQGGRDHHEDDEQHEHDVDHWGHIRFCLDAAASAA